MKKLKKVVIHEGKQILPKSYSPKVGLLVLLGFISLSLLLKSFIGILVLFLLLITLILIANPPLKVIFKRLLYFSPLIVVTFVSNIFFKPGRISFWGISYEGLEEGLLLSSKLLLGILGALVFVCSTDKLEIADSLDWLTFRKLKLYMVTILAINSLENIRRSLKIIKLRKGRKRISSLLSTTLSNSIKKGEKLAYSLTMRGYNR